MPNTLKFYIDIKRGYIILWLPRFSGYGKKDSYNMCGFILYIIMCDLMFIEKCILWLPDLTVYDNFTQ
jgi:hypothetical protein